MKSLTEAKLFRESEDLSDLIWRNIACWDVLARDTVGKELVNCIDSVSASLVESHSHTRHGRLHYLYTARGSLFKAFVFLEKAIKREAGDVERIGKCMEGLLPLINEHISTVERNMY
ncbi:MAG: hypothetical protein AUJ51_06170 [Elusimicrobia bacterium CG1_02_56_21]|nr:MAG: hypothetical protein AUJ51_06170 [Elusimicrobia bacterium CG1_02_56_21]